VDDATASLHILRDLSLEVSTTANLSLLAVAYLALGDSLRARESVSAALALLASCGGEGPDFPHRDYLYCYRVLMTLGEIEEASRALEQAYELLHKQANRISDPRMRRSFLHSVGTNAEILSEVAQHVDPLRA
jgi:tetratricopeptide (TPR) repeat protein